MPFLVKFFFSRKKNPEVYPRNPRLPRHQRRLRDTSPPLVPIISFNPLEAYCKNLCSPRRRDKEFAGAFDCAYLQPLKLGTGRDSWLIINISTTSTVGGPEGGKEGDCARWRRSRLGRIRSILSEYDGSTLHTRVAASERDGHGEKGRGRRLRGQRVARADGGRERAVDSKAGAFRSRVSAGISENAVELEYKGESGGLPRYICI